MRIGICTWSGAIADAKEAGLAYVELAAGELIADQDDVAFAPVRERLLAAPLKIEAFNCFIPGHIKVTGPAVDNAAVRRHMDVTLRRASEVGASIMVFGSGGARTAPDGFPLDTARRQYQDAAHMAAEIGAAYDITIALEPLLKRACNIFNRVEQGAAFVDNINHPNCRLLTDLYHFAAEEEPYANIIAAGARFAHAHLATPAIPETGDGVAYDFAGFLAALTQAGYNGRISLEDNPGLLGGKQPPFVNVFRAMREYVEANMPATV